MSSLLLAGYFTTWLGLTIWFKCGNISLADDIKYTKENRIVWERNYMYIGWVMLISGETTCILSYTESSTSHAQL